MRRASLLLAVLAVGFGAMMFGPAHAASTGTFSDPSKDTIDPVISQNAPTKTKQDIPVADMVSWSAQFNGLTNKIVYKTRINAKIPRPGPASAPIQAPPGFVGASYRLMFTSSTQQVSQSVGKNCAAFNDGHGLHQNQSYAQCTDTRQGPYKAPNFKMFIDFGVRQDVGTSGNLENEGTVAWGLFDTYGQGLTFHDVETEMPCSTATGYVLGGGSCPWGVQIASANATQDDLTLIMPYVPTWILGDDGDDNAVFNDELRSYALASNAATITGIIATAWVDQVVGSPVPICDPTDTACTGPGDDPAGETLSYVQNISDCTPPNNGNQRASCLQEIGGFVYVVDWAPDGGYDLGTFSYPLPGYIPSPSCRYQAGIPFVFDGRMPDGIALYSHPQRNSGYTGVVLPYGVRLHSDADYPAGDHNPYDNPNAPRPGYENIPTNGLAPSQTIENPLPNITVANPLLNDSTCTYTSFLGSKFIDANGKSVSGAGA